LLCHRFRHDESAQRPIAATDGEASCARYFYVVEPADDPLDIDRAYKKLEEIKPNVGLWWRTGDQTTQGFRTGEYQIGLIWLTRAPVLKNEARPIKWSYNGALLVGDRYGIIKGAPNKAEAEKLLEFFLNSPEVQAKICETLTCTPPSRTAVTKMSPAAQESMPTAEHR